MKKKKKTAKRTPRSTQSLLQTIADRMLNREDQRPRYQTEKKGGLSRPVGPEAKLAGELLKRGIQGVGYGLKETAGGLTPLRSVRVYVAGKRRVDDLNTDELIPSELQLGDAEVATDVVATGDIWTRRRDEQNAPSIQPAQSGGVAVQETSSTLTRQLAFMRVPVRKLACGLSVGPDMRDYKMAGTLGCFVRKAGEKSPLFALSNNHVIAGSRLEGRKPYPVKDGAPIYQPGTLDRSPQYVLDQLASGNAEQVPVGQLSEVVNLLPSNPHSPGVPSVNHVDAAIAEIAGTGMTRRPANQLFALPLNNNSSRFLNLRPKPAGIGREDLLLTTVAKVGRTTGVTMGEVVDVNANLWIPYGARDDWDSYAWFENQLTVVPIGNYETFSAGGDSGSLVFDARGIYPVGLLFAGSSNGQTFMNPIDEVFDALNVELA